MNQARVDQARLRTPQGALPINGNQLGEGAGFLILSTGDHRRTLLWECLAGIERHYPGAPVHVISDAPVDCSFTWLKHWHGRAYQGVGSRRYKTQLAKLSPFEITVALDDDTIIHHPFGRAIDWLEDTDLAMAPGFLVPDLKTFVESGRQGAHTMAARAAVNEVNQHKLYYTSGVMIFRSSHAVFRLFDAWHEDWLAHQHLDQEPLLTAVERTGIRVSSLPSSMNYLTSVEGEGLHPLEMKGYVLHFGLDKWNAEAQYRDRMRLQTAKPHRRFQLFQQLIGKEGGWCTADQYRAIGSIINALAPCRLLVFGGGKDSELWAELNRGGRTVFVENLKPWRRRLARQGLEVFGYDYPTTRGVWESRQSPIPETLGGAWDVVLVDGPRGDHVKSPGRELPVRWASQFSGNPIVFVHDWQRPWEFEVCERYLGTPDTVLTGGEKQCELAVWLQGREVAKQLFGYY